MGVVTPPPPSPRLITSGTSADIQSELQRFGCATLGAGSHLCDQQIVLSSGQSLGGLSEGVSTLIAAPSLAAHMVVNATREEQGNQGITVGNLSLNGNKAEGRNTSTWDNLSFIAAHGYRLSNLESWGSDRHGIYLSGNGHGGELAVRGGRASNIFVHDNTSHGWWDTNGMRGLVVVNLHAENNGAVGLVLDSSECHFYGAYSYGNLFSHGILITNVFGSQYHNLDAARNGKYGIANYAMNSCIGSGWMAQSNCKQQSPENEENKWDDIAFLKEALPGFSPVTYGTTQNTHINGILAGYEENYIGTRRERYALWVDNELGDLSLTNVTVRAGLTGTIRLPPEPSNLYLEEIT